MAKLLGRCQHLGVRASAGASFQETEAGPSDVRRVLGVGPNASRRDVKTAYRRLALEYHPDVCKGEMCDVRFLEVNRAYESLMHRFSSSARVSSREAHSSENYESSSWYSYSPLQGSSEEDDPWVDFLQSLVKPEQSTGDSTQTSTSSSFEGHW